MDVETLYLLSAFLLNKFATKKTPFTVPFLFVMFEEDLSLEDKLLSLEDKLLYVFIYFHKNIFG